MKKVSKVSLVLLVLLVLYGLIQFYPRPVLAFERLYDWGPWVETLPPTGQWRGYQETLQLAEFQVPTGGVVQVAIEVTPKGDDNLCQLNEMAQILDNEEVIYYFIDDECSEGFPTEFFSMFWGGEHRITSVWNGHACFSEEPRCNGSFQITTRMRYGAPREKKSGDEAPVIITVPRDRD